MEFMVIGIVAFIIKILKDYVTSRILWRLPNQTHSDLLTHITGIPPFDVYLSKRFLKHFHTSFSHDGSLVKFICLNAMHTDFRIR